MTTLADLGRAMAAQDVVTFSGARGFVITAVGPCDGACPNGADCVGVVTLVAVADYALQYANRHVAGTGDTLRIAA